MKVKILEIRDAATFILALAVEMNEPNGEPQRWALRRCGYPLDGYSNIMLTRLDGNGTPATNDPFFWQDRTWRVAHEWITDNWHKLDDGSVVDVEYILGERPTIKVSERLS